MIFSTAVVLFHFANAAMLPLVGQKLTAGRMNGAAGYMSACIIAAQLVMVPVAIVASRLADSWGRRAVFLAGFAVLPVRGVLYTLTTNPSALVAVQLLDGIGAGIFGVVGVLVIADLTRGTGRFNLVQGALGDGNRNRGGAVKSDDGLHRQGGGIQRRLLVAGGDRRGGAFVLQPGHAGNSTGTRRAGSRSAGTSAGYANFSIESTY